MRNLLKWIGVTSACVIGLSPAFSYAKEFKYRYIDIYNVSAPDGYRYFWPVWLNNLGEIAGVTYKCDGTSCIDYVAIYKNGHLRALQPGDTLTGNDRGTSGGYITDQNTANVQAALFRGHDHLTIIPEPPGDPFSFVYSLNNQNHAIVVGSTGLQYYSNGHTTELNFGPQLPNASIPRFPKLNDSDAIAVTNTTGFVNDRAFRFNVRTGMSRVLDPVQPDTQSWGMAVNNGGYVLGYSFVSVAPYHERIGIWDRFGHFTTYYDETINTDFLAFNDQNQILQPVQGEGAYLLPRPGVRLNLADLVEDLPPGTELDSAVQINNRGDIFGTFPSFFLLKRICTSEDESEANAMAEAAALAPHRDSAAATEFLKLHPQLRLPAQRALGPKHL